MRFYPQSARLPFADVFKVDKLSSIGQYPYLILRTTMTLGLCPMLPCRSRLVVQLCEAEVCSGLSRNPNNIDTSLQLLFNGTNIFFASGTATDSGFIPPTVTPLDGVEQPPQGRPHSRRQIEDGVLLFFSGLEDTQHNLTLTVQPSFAIKNAVVFMAGEAVASSDKGDDHQLSSGHR